MSYMPLIQRMRNCSVHSMPLERRYNLKGGNMSTMVAHLNNKVACLECYEGQAHKG
jgi:hypothetical protein